MRYPSNSVFKSSLVLLSLTGLLGNYDAGERTLDRENTQSAVIERSMKASDDRTDTLASCIAQPSSWPAPLEVIMVGSAQVAGATQDFSVTAIRYTEGETTLASLHKINDYTWYCYTDIERDYGYEATQDWVTVHADGGKVQYTLTPDSDNTQVYTTIGMINGGWDRRGTQYFYKEMASHHVIKNDTTAAHFEKIANSLMQDGYNPADDSFQIFHHNDSVFFVGYKGKAFVTKMDGNYEVRDVPLDSQIYLLNNFQLIASKIYFFFLLHK